MYVKRSLKDIHSKLNKSDVNLHRDEDEVKSSLKSKAFSNARKKPSKSKLKVTKNVGRKNSKLSKPGQNDSSVASKPSTSLVARKSKRLNSKKQENRNPWKAPKNINKTQDQRNSKDFENLSVLEKSVNYQVSYWNFDKQNGTLQVNQENYDTRSSRKHNFVMDKPLSTLASFDHRVKDKLCAVTSGQFTPAYKDVHWFTKHGSTDSRSKNSQNRQSTSQRRDRSTRNLQREKREFSTASYEIQCRSTTPENSRNLQNAFR